MAISPFPNGARPFYTDLDWSASFHAAPGPNQRRPCSNPDCVKLTEALFCSPACREHTEGPDEEIEPDGEERPAPHQTPADAVGGPSAGKTVPPVPPRLGGLPEAPASVNTFITLAGHQVQVTLRDEDEFRLLERLKAVLAKFPVGQTPTAASAQTPVCASHGAMKESTKAAGTFYCPAKMADGSYCKSRSPHQGR